MVICDICNKELKNRLALHKKTVHNSNAQLFYCDEDECSYKTKYKSGITTHKKNIHLIGTTYYNCSTCKFTTKTKHGLENHIINMHTLDPPLFYCNDDNCNYACKNNNGLKIHIINKHTIKKDIIWITCGTENCEKKFKTSTERNIHISRIHNEEKSHQCDDCPKKFNTQAELKKHIVYIHTNEEDIIWINCKIENCKKKFKTPSGLNSHISSVHNKERTHQCDSCPKKFNVQAKLNIHVMHIHTNDKDIIWIICDEEKCKKKFKTVTGLNRHKQHSHEKYIKWVTCDQENCSYKSKDNSGLRRHKANIHNINLSWHSCNQENCSYRAKSNSHLKSHLERIHDIGDHKCDFCLSNRNSHIKHEDSLLCRECFNKATGKTSRVEKKWSDYIDKHLGTEFLSSNDRSLKSNGGCQLYRPDKLYIGIDMVEVDECDEHQHQYSSGGYSCDEKRISDIYEEKGICGKTLVVIRWNPDHYVVPDGYSKKKRAERLEMMVSLKRHLRANPPQDKITIYYMFYDMDNELITKNYPKKLIYSDEDYLS